MRITILNGEPDAASSFQAYLKKLANRLQALGHAVTKLDLAALDLKGCTGCWNCWVKTPGECAKRDDSATVCRAVLSSDLLLLASPMTMGFTTALLKRAADQMVPLVHPYFVVEGGEIHHRARYAHYPVFALLLGTGPDNDAEDVEITRTMWGRMARNIKSRLAWSAVAEGNAEEVADELARVA
ncbi:MAG TPA: NAD(P)H-dependent oxidoreductase [Terracidiphilus sp.]|nr:NAD(P)H-dependent oxidoreductase [Terracidiphilus sp.]